MVFTVIAESSLDISCYQSSSNEIDSLYNNNEVKELNSTSFSLPNNYVVVADLINIKENPFFYISLSNKGKEENKITLLMTETENYKTEYKTEKILNPAAYVAYKMDYLEMNEKVKEEEFLLSTTKGRIIIYCYLQQDNIYEYKYREYKFFPFNQHSIAFLYNDYKGYNAGRNFLIFIGVDEYIENDDITIFFNHTEKETKLYFYNYQLNSHEFFNFYYDCSDNYTEHYLFINLDKPNRDETYTNYFRFHDLVGSEAKIAQISNEEYDYKKYNYTNLDKFNYYTPDENKMHIIKLQCSGEGNKILANIIYDIYDIKYNESNIVSLESYQNFIDIPFTFDNNELTVDYSKIYGNIFEIKILTISEENNMNFTLTFENTTTQIINDKSYIFTIKDKLNFTTFKIESKEKIETFISILSGGRLNEENIRKEVKNPNNDYLRVYRYDISFETFYTYEIIHEFNTNYYIDFEISDAGSLTKFCYLVANVPLLYGYSQNCYVMNDSEIKNISLHNIYKYNKNEDYNIDEKEKYYLVVFYQNPGMWDILQDIYYRNDLPSSQLINNIDQGHNYQYLDKHLDKNIASYFSIELLNSTNENNINLYIINKTETNYNELQFDIKCIIKYEPCLESIKKYFDEPENYCYIINNEDYNSNVFHIIYKDTKKDKHEKLIIQIKSKIDMNIKLIIDKSKIISHEKYNQQSIIEDSFVHQIFELNTNDLSPIVYNYRIIYNKHYNGLKLFARDNYNFKQIKIGSLIVINKDEFLEKYKNYSKFLLIIGQDDYFNNQAETNTIYQVIDKEKINYYSISEFNGNYRIPIQQITDDEIYNYNLIFDYGKQYLKNDIHFINYTLLGNNDILISYYPKLEDNLFEDTNKIIKENEIINDNKQHLILMKFDLSKNYEGYFDFVSEIDYTSKIINLDKSAVYHYIISKNKNYTFNYEKADIIKIELLNETIKPIIYFENKLQTFNNKIITLKKSNNDSDVFYIWTPSDLSYSNIPIRLITLINTNNLEKTKLPNLYKCEGKYIYNYQPKNIKKVIFKLKLITTSLRLLKAKNNANSAINVCYNLANMIILEEKGNNCFVLEDTKEIEYENDLGYDLYFTFYSEAGNDKFTFDQINEEKKPSNENDKNDGSNTWIIILVVVLVVLLIGVGALLIYKFKYKKYSSDEIENLVNK